MDLLFSHSTEKLLISNNQGYHIVLISKICPWFSVQRLRKYYCPYF